MYKLGVGLAVSGCGGLAIVDGLPRPSVKPTQIKSNNHLISITQKHSIRWSILFSSQSLTTIHNHPITPHITTHLKLYNQLKTEWISSLGGYEGCFSKNTTQHSLSSPLKISIFAPNNMKKKDKLDFRFNMATEEEGASYEARLMAEVQEQEGK